MFVWDEDAQDWVEDPPYAPGESTIESPTFWDQVTSDIGSIGWDDIRKLLQGSSVFGPAGAVVAAGGIGSLLNKLFGGSSPSGPLGYRGGIPQYTASFTQTPAAQQRPSTTAVVPATSTTPQQTVTTPYRPGQGGITYFNPIQYTYTGRDLAAPAAAVVPAPAPPPAPAPTVPESTGVAQGGFMNQGIAMLAGGGNGSRYLRGPGDGVSDSIPAQFEQSGRPARLADGEFVFDARTVSEIGNGSSEAGARKLYEFLDRVHAARRNAERGEPSGADKLLKRLA